MSRTARLLFVPIAALCLVLGAGAFSVVVVQSSADKVTLPVEVIGPDGYTVSVPVAASDVSDVDRLYVKAHSIGYPYHIAEGRGYNVDKASIRINDGSWVDVNNSTVNCFKPESTVRCISGPMHTVRFTIPISALGSLTDGKNVVHFRFNWANPSGELGDASTGYRILDLELRSSSGADQIDGTSFVWDDPGKWSAPSGYDTSSDVDAGKTLWYKRDHLTEGWSGPNIQAACADCHVENGYDLEYFAYSNKSIIERAEFHGLSEDQGKKIAAYIRSLDITTEDGRTIDPPGRPWHPPYQPGPTSVASRSPEAPRTNGTRLDNMAPVYWAAGAGVEWALESDDKTKRFLFPNGIFPDALPVTGTLNMRELPVALQMPDWNEWLPAVHPMDVWGSDFTSSDAWDFYENDVPDAIDSGKPGKVAFTVQDVWKKTDNFRPGSAPAPFDDDTDYGIADLGRMQWALTKTFEILQPHHYEDDADELYGNGAEPRQWPSLSRILFDQAPHIQGPVKGATSGIMDRYHDAVWYQHQLTLNPGSGISTSLKPVDWKYHYGHLSAVQEYGPHVWRYVASYGKALQIADKLPDDYSSTEPEGWYLRHLTPGIIDTRHHWGNLLAKGLSDREYRQVLNVLLTALGDGMTPEPLSEWARTTGQDGIEPSDWSPSFQSRYDRTTYADHFWTALQGFGEAGAAYETLEPLATWAESAWPKGDWKKHISAFKDNPPVDDNQSPSVSIVSPEESASYTEPASISIEASASDPDGNVAKVEFFAGDAGIGSDSKAPYDLSWTNVPSGRYALTARATDDDGTTTTSSPVEVTVKRAGGVTPGVFAEYYEGTWTQLPDFESVNAVAEDTTADFNLSPAQRGDYYGFRFTSYVEIPSSESGSYTFYTTSDDGSRLLVDGNEVVVNDGVHAPEEQSGTVSLSAGWHEIAVEYFENAGGASLTVSWAGPSISKQEIPSSRLFLAPGGTPSQTISLDSGWNVVSSRIRPDTTDLPSVFSDVNVQVVKDEDGNVYVPSENRNEIGSWKATEAYKVYVESSQSLTIEGSVVADTTTIPLQEGWNLVPYLPANAQSVTASIESISDALVIMKDETGQTYVPAYGVNEMGQLRPTEGYQILVDHSVDLVYSSGSSSKQTSASTAATRQGHNVSSP